MTAKQSETKVQDHEDWSCPVCGSDDVQRFKPQLEDGIAYINQLCGDCKEISTRRYRLEYEWTEFLTKYEPKNE